MHTTRYGSAGPARPTGKSKPNGTSSFYLIDINPFHLKRSDEPSPLFPLCDRLSLAAGKECAADEVMYSDSPLCMERSAEVCEPDLQSAVGGSVSGGGSLWRWLLERLTAISKQLSAAALSDGTAYWQLKQEVSVFCLVFRHVCVPAVPPSKLSEQEQDQDYGLMSVISPRIRGLVQQFTALDGPQSLRAWTIGLDLLQCAAASKLCVGNGLWLPAVLTNLMSSAAQVRS